MATAGLVPVLALMVGNLIFSAEAVKDGGLLSAGGRSSPAVLFIVIGTVCGLAMFLQVSTIFVRLKWSLWVLQTAMFGISCERFTSRLRRRVFECVVRQEIPWFELSYVSTGALTCLLSKDSALVQAMSGCKGSSLLHGVLGVIFSVAIVINIDPKLGLLTALFILAILAAIVFCMKVTYDVDIKVKSYMMY